MQIWKIIFICTLRYAQDISIPGRGYVPKKRVNRCETYIYIILVYECFQFCQFAGKCLCHFLFIFSFLPVNKIKKTIAHDDQSWTLDVWFTKASQTSLMQLTSMFCWANRFFFVLCTFIFKNESHTLIFHFDIGFVHDPISFDLWKLSQYFQKVNIFSF